MALGSKTLFWSEDKIFILFRHNQNIVWAFNHGTSSVGDGWPNEEHEEASFGRRWW